MGLIKFTPGQLVLWTSHNGVKKAGWVMGEAEEGLTQWFYNISGMWCPQSQLEAL